MKSNVHYVIIILVIFVLQIGFYSSFRSYEEAAKMNPNIVKKLKMQNEKLQLELSIYRSKSKNTADRSIASVGQPAKEPIDMSDFYLKRVEQLMKQKKNELALQYLSKLKENTLQSEQLAKATFFKLQLQCSNLMMEKCLSDVDELITQYPDSIWTGRSLVYLSEYYKKNQQLPEFQSLNQIITTYFGQNLDAVKQKL